MVDTARITILDGGMSTTLETLGHDVSGPMWGSEILVEQPEVIADVHERWLEAGAELVGTCTYQMTMSGLAATNSPDQAGQIMGRSISLASQACHSAEPLSTNTPSPGCSDAATSSKGQGAVVLSLGPFGAHLKPSQEYAGVYPPPYGSSAPPAPASGSESGSVPTPNHFASTPEGRQEEARAEASLAAWHLERLRAFAASPASSSAAASSSTSTSATSSASASAWYQLQWVAFETVPLLTEIRAVRRAMAILNTEMDLSRRKKFWVCSAFPNGLFPQTKPAAAGTDEPNGQAGHVGMNEWVAAALGPLDALAFTLSETDGKDMAAIAALQGESIPPADAIGINCTSPAFLPRLTRDLTDALTRHTDNPSGSPSGGRSQPQLVLYPDGGAVYDTTTKKWTNRTSGAEDWARDVSAVARDAEGAKCERGESVWGGVIVGGCCKAGFDEIRLLRRALKP